MRHIGYEKLLALFIVLLMGILPMSAQDGKKKGRFDPKRFEIELEQYITTNAGLTPSESAKFFPVYRQMTKRMRSIFDQMRRYHHVDPRDVKACAEAIRKQDELDIEMKTLQQEYHMRFMLILPANKVLEIIKAEERFHRQAFKRMRDREKDK